MAEPKEIDINSLYSIVLRETEIENIQELDSDFYKKLSRFIGELRRQEYDGVEEKIKDSLLELTTKLTSLLIKIRLEKVTSSEEIKFSNLLDEEKYILESEEERKERTEMILSATVNGKSKLLESLSYKHKTKPVVVRFLKEMDELVGVDLERYGPFKPEDIATLPFENAQALISQEIATKIRWQD